MFLVIKYMRINLLKSKLHRAKITNVELNYEGSCAIDQSLMESANINEFEMLHIYNLNNGNRFTTYAIKAEKNSGIISFNGAAAYKGEVGDLIIICTYAEIESSKVNLHKPKLVYFKENTNIIDTVKSKIAEQKKGKIINL